MELPLLIPSTRIRERTRCPDRKDGDHFAARARAMSLRAPGGRWLVTKYLLSSGRASNTEVRSSSSGYSSIVWTWNLTTFGPVRASEYTQTSPSSIRTSIDP